MAPDGALGRCARTVRSDGALGRCARTVRSDGALGRRDAAAVGCRRDHRQVDVHIHGARVDDDGDACPGALGPVLPPHERHRTTAGGPRGGGIRLVGQRRHGGGVWGGGDGGVHLHHEGGEESGPAPPSHGATL